MTQGDEEFQERVLRAYTVLRLLRTDWGGALIVCCGLGPQGAAVAMGANIAGAVCLSVEEKPELLKGALRSGCCDFIVNTLDEALRAMKNEARRHRPISVGLLGNASRVLRDSCERGVQTEVIVDLAAEGGEGLLEDVSLQQLRRQGALLVSFDENASGDVDAFDALGRFVQERRWELRSFLVSDAAGLRAFDARAHGLLAEGDTLRGQWLRAAPRIVQRQRPLRRALWVTAEERIGLEGDGY